MRTDYPTAQLPTEYGTVTIVVLDPNEHDDEPLTHANSSYNGNERTRQREPACMLNIERDAPIVVNRIPVYGCAYLEWRPVWDKENDRHDPTRCELAYAPRFYSSFRRVDNNGTVTSNISSKLWALASVAAEYLTSHPEQKTEARAITLAKRVSKTAGLIEEAEKNMADLRARHEAERRDLQTFQMVASAKQLRT